jgi:hypothetical protein
MADRKEYFKKYYNENKQSLFKKQKRGTAAKMQKINKDLEENEKKAAAFREMLKSQQLVYNADTLTNKEKSGTDAKETHI